MILFYTPGASSLAPHILLQVSGLGFTLEKVDLTNKRWAGGDFNLINPKSYVPVLQLENGQRLTECSVILQYIADTVPEQALLPAVGSFARYEALQWLSFLAMEVQKNFITPERHGGVSANFLARTEAGQQQTRERVSPRLAFIDQHLAGREHVLGDGFSALDAYLFTLLTWARRLAIDLGQWRQLDRYFASLKAHPAIHQVLETEGPPHALRPAD
ncbi:glutathione S-transferase [Pseudomonas chlororaphis subsp. aurantiaca]|uniref:glutathione S-transferase C-terminal domain-containing protein n=1 Tax=Pseudomonas chlororaphis TaxID=587753 RepID=UPI000866141D|nr:glutathione S-transferase C-terminal domain-containing protein [Pseudomonas chlororaphis]BAV73154.1 glutathione S-transferase [Pseudomonas chlororaphis subsp. aurantiaca]